MEFILDFQGGSRSQSCDLDLASIPKSITHLDLTEVLELVYCRDNRVRLHGSSPDELPCVSGQTNG